MIKLKVRLYFTFLLKCHSFNEANLSPIRKIAQHVTILPVFLAPQYLLQALSDTICIVLLYCPSD